MKNMKLKKNMLVIVVVLLAILTSNITYAEIHSNMFKAKNDGWKYDEIRYYNNHVRVENGQTNGTDGKYALLDGNRNQLTDYKYESLVAINAKGYYNTTDNMCFYGTIKEKTDYKNENATYEIINNKGEVILTKKGDFFPTDNGVDYLSKIPLYFTSKDEFVAADSGTISYGRERIITYYSYKDGEFKKYSSNLYFDPNSEYQYTTNRVIAENHEIVDKNYINKKLNSNLSGIDIKFKKYNENDSGDLLNIFYDEIGNEKEVLFIGYDENNFQKTIGMINRKGEISISFTPENLRELDKMELEKYGDYYILKSNLYPEETIVTRIFDKNYKEYLTDMRIENTVVNQNKYRKNGNLYIDYKLIAITDNKVYLIDNDLNLKDTIILPKENADGRFQLLYTPEYRYLSIELHDLKDYFFTGESKLVQRHVYDEQFNKLNLSRDDIYNKEQLETPIDIVGINRQQGSLSSTKHPYIVYPQNINGQVSVSAMETFYIMGFSPVIKNNSLVGENPQGLRVELELKDGVDTIKAGKNGNIREIKLNNKLKKIDGSYMIALREVFEKLGYKVDYQKDYSPRILIKDGGNNGK